MTPLHQEVKGLKLIKRKDNYSIETQPSIGILVA
jgi:hypothetical protein